MSYTVKTKHGNVGTGDVWGIRQKDGTKAVLYFGNPRGVFFEVTKLLPVLDREHVFSRDEFESCSSAKRLATLWHDQISRVVDALWTRKIVDALEREHNNL